VRGQVVPAPVLSFPPLFSSKRPGSSVEMIGDLPPSAGRSRRPTCSSCSPPFSFSFLPPPSGEPHRLFFFRVTDACLKVPCFFTPWPDGLPAAFLPTRLVPFSLFFLSDTDQDVRPTCFFFAEALRAPFLQRHGQHEDRRPDLDLHVRTFSLFFFRRDHPRGGQKSPRFKTPGPAD